MAKYPATKATLAVGSFLAFSALTAYFAARGVPGDAHATAPPPPARIVIVQPNGDAQVVPAPSAVQRPVTRTRGS